jgi:hypothetical protein
LTLKWTLEAKEELRRISVAYMRRRAKARIEKTARVRRLSTISREFVLPIVHESIVEGEAIGATPARGKNGSLNGHQQSEKPMAADSLAAGETVQIGTFSWTQEALNRLHRVPEGFMRDMTREKIEDYARRHEVALVTLDVAEKGIEVGRQLMAEMIVGYSQAKKEGNSPRGEPAATSVEQPTVLNEIPSIQGTHT